MLELFRSDGRFICNTSVVMAHSSFLCIISTAEVSTKQLVLLT